MKSFAQLMTETSLELQDTSNATYTKTAVTGELPIQMEDVFREISDYKAHVMMHTFEIESRTGQATTDTTDALVDSQAQFVSTDVDKAIYNTTDNTWAIVTAYVSSTQLTLSKDIFPDGDENYKMFNKGCWTNKQINIEDVIDDIGPDHGVIRVEYKTQQSTSNPFRQIKNNYRNFDVQGDILTIDFEFEPPDSATSGVDIEVFVWFNKRQRVSQLTDLLGAIDLVAGYAAGSTTLHVDDFASAETIAEGTLLTIAGIRGIYTVTKDALLASNEIDITIWPGIESAAAENDVITIIGSTLNSRLERVAVELCAARAALSKHSNFISTGGSATFSRYQSKLDGALLELRRMKKPRTKRTWPKD